jgi:hypothetical protein
MTERLFLSIRRGTTPGDATPVIVSDDQELIASVAREVARRLGLHVVHDQDGTVRELRRVPLEILRGVLDEEDES